MARNVCEVLDAMIKDEAVAGQSYRDLKRAVKKSCPVEAGELCERVVENILGDEEKHSETLKELRKVICGR